MASHDTLIAEVQRSGSTEEIPVLPEVFETATEATVSAVLQVTEPSEGAPELSKTSGDSKFDLNADNLPPVQADVEVPVLAEVCDTAPEATPSADMQTTEPSEGAPELSKTSQDTKVDVNADNLPPGQEDVARFHAAAGQAMHILRSAVCPYLPLDRHPWKQSFMGFDLVNHNRVEKPFNDVGIILMAAQLVKTWEKAVADDLKAKIAVVGQSPQITSRTATSITPVKMAQQQPKATLPHKPLSQPIAHAWTLPKNEQNFEKHVVIGGGLLFIKEGYVRRLELENLVYRQHLHGLEEGVFEKALKELSKIRRKKPSKANMKAKAAINPSSPAMKPKANGAKRGSDEVEGSGLVKRPKLGPHHSRGADVSDAIVISED